MVDCKVEGIKISLLCDIKIRLPTPARKHFKSLGRTPPSRPAKLIIFVR